MHHHSCLNDETFEASFREASLDPSLFSHEAHIRLAWIHICKYGVEGAVQNICRDIKRYDATHGDGTKYNETVTVAAVRAVNHFMERSSTQTFGDFILENSRLLSNFKQLLDSHYSMNIFADNHARHTYLEPDLAPF